jgi:NitT/TauT family transport system substrate-binding protein
VKIRTEPIRGIVYCLLAVSVLAMYGAHNIARAEAKEVRIAQQFGLQFLAVNVMVGEKLIEKHAKALGLGDVKVRLIQLSGGATVNDALLSGNIDIGGAGTTPLIKIWEKTRGGANIRALAPTSDAPMYLVTADPKIKSIRDYTDKDKIAVPSVKVSINATVLQMAAEKEFGKGNYEKLDPFTVGLPHPDAVAMLRSGGSEVKSHMGIMPYTMEELQIPGARVLLTSYDVLGGPHSVSVLYNTEKWKNDNPKTFKAVAAAFEEAMEIINKDKRAAAEIFIRETKSKLPLESVYEILKRDDIIYTTTPERVMKFADFLYRTGSIKVMPASWKDLFWENVYDKPGS